MKTNIRKWLIPVMTVLLVLGALSAPQTAHQADSAPPGPANRVLARALNIETGLVQRQQYEQRVSSGALYTVLQATGEIDKRVQRANVLQNVPKANNTRPLSSLFTQGCQNIFWGRNGLNIRVNQDCSLRRQAEEVVIVNPTNPLNLIAGQNDSRIGYNHCGYDWSFDGGRTWGDQIPPFYQFVLADGHTADACSDPTATFDTVGNAYVAGVLFDINSNASALVVAKSNADIGGAFYHSPDSTLPFQTYNDVPLGVVASDNDPNIFHDKEFIVSDASPSSPKKNNVYATWTRFDLDTGAGVGGHSPIYFSQSTDGGATWSPGIEVSGANPAFCIAFSGETDPNACDQDQGSHPIVGRDGTVYVAFGNGNTTTLGVNQHLIVSCPPTADCSVPANWTAPAKITDDIGTQPIGPDPVSGCPFGRQCLPTNGYRLDDFVEGSVSVDNSGKLYFVWADYRNGGGTCTWQGGANGSAATATPPCDNDVFYAFSTDGGTTWSPPVNLTPAAKFRPSAQWQPWSAVAPDGKSLWVAYYDRSYGNCEFTGCNDITLARVKDPASNSAKKAYTRLTTSSMPNLVVANNPAQAGFLGDYMWVTVDGKGQPSVVWADTRGLRGTVEEDIYLWSARLTPGFRMDDGH